MYASLFLTLSSLFVVAACRRSHHRYRYPSVLGLALRIIPVRRLQWRAMVVVGRVVGRVSEEGSCHHHCFHHRRRLWIVVSGFAVPFHFISVARFSRNKREKRII